jgi:hypothetical protein
MPLTGITAVRPTDSTIYSARPVVYGGTTAVGELVYLDTTNKYLLCDNNLSVVTAALKGIALTPGVLDGYGLLATEGSILIIGPTLVVGVTYYAGPTAGQIIAESELASGHFVSRLGTAATTSRLDLSIKATGIQRP